MSGIEITSGGAISVDPDEVRIAARRVQALSDALISACVRVRRAHAAVLQVPESDLQVDMHAFVSTAAAIEHVATRAATVAEGMRLMADVFELVELRARAEMLAISGTATESAVQSVQDRIAELVAADPRLDAMATERIAAWQRAHAAGMFTQPLEVDLLVTFPALAGALVGMISALTDPRTDHAIIPPGAHLSRPTDAVKVIETARSAVAAPPKDLTQTLQRVPKGQAQIRVEKYTFADGSVRYTAFIDGSRSTGPSAEQPFDLTSNTDMYLHRKSSASYEATLKALEMAGAKPGDRVDVVGYSQAGMIADHLATSGRYDTKMVVVAGGPTQAQLAPDQTRVTLMHTDDPVGSGLSDGGLSASPGSPASFTVSREAIEGVAMSSLSAHDYPKYLETARMADTSGDARVRGYHEYLESLESAVSIERTDYLATRA